jgi:homopolymeric O-antigen transport system ATP-binding protein
MGSPMSSDTSTEVSIRAEGLGKSYAIFKRPEDRLKQMVMRGRRKYYDDYWALTNVNFEVKRGETVAVIGRNGSGKSTFLQLVCGTLKPTTGTIAVNGRVGALLELGAGFNPEFTGRENVYLSGTILGLTQTELGARFQSIADFSGIGDFIDQPVKLYSSGMYARLAFALMAHVDADVLIVDEILSVGDAAFGQKCMRFIRKFCERGTLLFVSHDTAAVLALCERAIWLEAGTVRAIGDAREICSLYQASIEGEKDNVNAFKIGGSRKPPPAEIQFPADSREETFKDLGLVPKVRVFDFDPNAPWFGTRGASIDKVSIVDVAGQPVTSFEGGEEITLKVDCIAHQAITRPIIGFIVKDRLGQEIFGDNTFLTYRNRTPVVAAGMRFSARFVFRLPYLRAGDYSVTIGLAEGTQEEHVQHHWADDTLFFNVTVQSVKGLVGIPMRSVELVIDPTAEPSSAQISDLSPGHSS